MEIRMDSDFSHWHFDYVRLAWDSGFFFGNSKDKSNIDYSSIALVDIEKISRDRDIAVVEKHLPTIVNFFIEEELTKILEPTFVKIFKLGQLSIQYLQFCKKYLDNTVILLKKELSEKGTEVDWLKKENENLETNVTSLKKKLKELKMILQTQELQHVHGASFSCPHCCKIFSTTEYLEAHVARRHTENDHKQTNMQMEADKLQLEIKELKERLNSTEKFIYVDKTGENNEVAGKHELQNKLELHRQHVESELNAIRSSNELYYEKWSETMMQKWQESQVKEDGDNRNIHTISRGCSTTNESYTQTESPMKMVDSNVNTDMEIPANVNFHNEIDSIKHVAEVQLENFEKVLETKVTGSLGKLELKMQTLLKKFNQLEEIKETNIPDPKELIIIKPYKKVETRIPKPAPRVSVVYQKEKVDKAVGNEIIVNHRPRNKILTCTKSSVMYSGNFREKSPVETSSSESSSSSSSSSEESENEEIEVVENKKSIKEVQPVVKISNTSTLRNRSLTSLRKAVDENVTKGLLGEIQEILNGKLESVGVSPNWTGIPKKSYEQAMKHIIHQNNLTSKKYFNFKKIRETITKTIQAKLALKSNKSPTRYIKKNNGKTVQKLADKRAHLAEIKEVLAKRAFEKSSEKPTQLTKTSTNKDEMIRKDNLPIASKVATISTKKKVLFDLDTEETSSATSSEEKQTVAREVAPSIAATGSTTSVASSVLDDSQRGKLADKEAKRKLDEKAKKTTIIEEDTSDWDVSDILGT